MVGQRIGYVRVSTLDQNEKCQLEGQVLDRVYTDKASGRDTARPQLGELLRFARDGDIVVVHSMDRLARNLDDLRALVQGLTRRGVRVEFVKESLVFTGEDSPMANLMLSVMGAFAEFERALIRERQREGIALAQQRGAYKGRKKTLTPERAAELVQRAVTGVPKALLAREYGISRETVYQYLRYAKPPAPPPTRQVTTPRPNRLVLQAPDARRQTRPTKGCTIENTARKRERLGAQPDGRNVGCQPVRPRTTLARA
jgi:DNA invertase Pin-like site-specific DNA recombinase